MSELSSDAVVVGVVFLGGVGVSGGSQCCNCIMGTVRASRDCVVDDVSGPNDVASDVCCMGGNCTGKTTGLLVASSSSPSLVCDDDDDDDGGDGMPKKLGAAS
eukprot:scaffold37593_cov56-Attheya_sp.AAC.1